MSKASDSASPTEKTTLVVTARDRFSTAERCLDNLFKQTPEPFDLIVVLGGAPKTIEERLRNKFGSRVQWVFEPDFLNTAQARNRALRLVQTRLAIFLDTDVFVRPGWYEPLVDCQLETGAMMTTPIVLDKQNRIHTAGNNFFITQQDGKKYAMMELRYAGQYAGTDMNIQRQESDFCEVHCQLVVADVARKLGIYDENLREFHEMDSGLTLLKHGCKMVLEQKSTVYLYYTDRLTDVEDVAIFCWKWDMDVIRKGIDYFEKKWGMNVNQKDITIKYFEMVNRRANFFTRRWPSRASLRLDMWKKNLFQHVFRYWE